MTVWGMESFQHSHTRSLGTETRVTKLREMNKGTRVKVSQAEGTESTKDFGQLICFI